MRVETAASICLIQCWAAWSDRNAPILSFLPMRRKVLQYLPSELQYRHWCVKSVVGVRFPNAPAHVSCVKIACAGDSCLICSHTLESFELPWPPLRFSLVNHSSGMSSLTGFFSGSHAMTTGAFASLSAFLAARLSALDFALFEFFFLTLYQKTHFEINHSMRPC